MTPKNYENHTCDRQTDADGRETCEVYFAGYNEAYANALIRKEDATERYNAGHIAEWEIAYSVNCQIYNLDEDRPNVNPCFRRGYIAGTYAVSGGERV